MKTKKLTFKEYVESKSQLREALKLSPIVSTTYTVNNYCRFSIGESSKDKTVLNLKPSTEMVVEWKFDSSDLPKCLSVIIENKKQKVYWKSEKIENWLLKNTRQEL